MMTEEVYLEKLTQEVTGIAARLKAEALATAEMAEIIGQKAEDLAKAFAEYRRAAAKGEALAEAQKVEAKAAGILEVIKDRLGSERTKAAAETATGEDSLTIA